jgi:hypothetical protein
MKNNPSKPTVLAFAVLAATGAPTGALAQTAAAPTQAVPFEATRENVNPILPPGSGRCAPRFFNTIEIAPGRLSSTGTSNLGDFTATISHCVTSPPPTQVVDGRFTFTFRAGDTITGTFAGDVAATPTPGVFAVSENLVVTGGTGRFAGASGTIAEQGTLRPLNGNGNLEATLTGSLLAPTTTASGAFSTALGVPAAATGEYATSVGAFSIATGARSTAAGALAEATAEGATATGARSRAGAAGSSAFGVDASATGINAIALGQGAVATQMASSVLGATASASAPAATAIGHNTQAGALASFAGGVSARATGVGSTSLGRLSQASAEGATATGAQSIAGAASASAYGAGASATGVDATALGQGAAATELASTALGATATATAPAATAIGHNTQATGVASFAGGVSARATGVGSTSLGRLSQATAVGATALGTAAEAGFAGSTAIGAGARTTAANQVALGASGGSVRVGDMAASTAAQTGELSLVTTDASGTLGRGAAVSSFATAADVTSIRSAQAGQAGQLVALRDGQTALFDLARVNRRDIGRANEGVALALAMESPQLPADARFAVAGGVGYFRDRGAATFAFAARVGTMSAVTGGVGVGFRSGDVGARAGVQHAW